MILFKPTIILLRDLKKLEYDYSKAVGRLLDDTEPPEAQNLKIQEQIQCMKICLDTHKAEHEPVPSAPAPAPPPQPAPLAPPLPRHSRPRPPRSSLTAQVTTAMEDPTPPRGTVTAA